VVAAARPVTTLLLELAYPSDEFDVAPFRLEMTPGECSASLTSFRLLSVVPESALCLLTGEEMSRIVYGAKTVDVERPKQWNLYNDDVSPEDAHIIAFWECLQFFRGGEVHGVLIKQLSDRIVVPTNTPRQPIAYFLFSPYRLFRHKLNSIDLLSGQGK